MLIFKYEKNFPSAFAGHTDTLRTMTHIFRRAKCNVSYSNGFNPHMELYFSPALPLGAESDAEYVAAKMECEPDMLGRLNAVSCEGIRFVAAYLADVNVASVADAATYRVCCKNLGTFARELKSDRYVIEYEEKGAAVSKDVSDRIFDVRVIDSDTFDVTLACGNINLRCDRLVNHMRGKHDVCSDYSIRKTQTFAKNICMDEYLLANGKLIETSNV
ncbi:MAG: TIGR03936 family radical SAM-associated protein [Corallococcus sp.]|nr:TIGR03936 family radical SAM-associated protein [Corallococcus sp.]